MSLTRWCSCSGAPTMAMQPEWLTSTVTPLARWHCAPSSHSTWKRTCEMMRLWVRIFAQRSSRSFLIGPAMMFVAMDYLAAIAVYRGRGKSQGKPDKGNGSIVLGQKVRGGFERAD